GGQCRRGPLVRQPAEVGRRAPGEESQGSRSHLGVTRETGPVTPWGPSIRDLESFGATTRGPRRTFMVLLGPPSALSQTRESGGMPALEANACEKGGKRETPGGEPLGVRG